MLGERIKRARIAAGLSQREAAKRAGLSAMAISKFERGLAAPTSKTLLRLARALDTRTEFFLRPDTVTVGKLEFRKRSSLRKKQLARIRADVLDQVERFLELLSIFPNDPVPAFEVPGTVPDVVASLEDVEEAALAVRDAWLLGRNAIPCMADTIEKHGIIVLTTDVDESRKFDGLATKANGYPVIVVGASWPGDRQRFTMAHELGHLVLEDRLGKGIEEEAACDRFAGAFLAPRDAVLMELGSRRNRIEPRELYQLKHEYGLSMQAWVHRARDVGVITPRVAKILFRTFSHRGWRKQEPGEPYPSERPHMFEQLVMNALAEDMISLSKAAELMSLPLGEFRDRLGIESPNAAAHQ